MRLKYIKDKVRISSLLIGTILLVLVISWSGSYSNGVGFEIHAQSSSSCDRTVVSLIDCSPTTSSSASTDDSSTTDNNHQEENNNEDDKSDDQKEEEKSGDIESQIPSTVSGGVPFP